MVEAGFLTVGLRVYNSLCSRVCLPLCWVMRRPLLSESLSLSSKHFSRFSSYWKLLFSFWEISSTLSFIPLLTFLLMSLLISKSSCSMYSFFKKKKKVLLLHHRWISSFQDIFCLCVWICVCTLSFYLFVLVSLLWWRLC